MNSTFSLYIHIPFCQKKCPYCDFNSYAIDAGALSKKENIYVSALIAELKSKINEYTLSDKFCTSIFFGGGTPSLLSTESFRRILEAIFSGVRVSPQCEVSVEVNPKSISEDYDVDTFSALIESGVNRISMGAQSFSGEKLRFLGRWHTNQDVLKSVQLLQEAGIRNFNLDLMFGVKGEDIEVWRHDLETAVSLSPTHISAYMLTMEPGTEFGKRTRKGEVLITDEDTFVELYEATRTYLFDNGYDQYEVSNYARNGFSCVHNVNYWEGGSYIGLGAGAHSFVRFTELSGLRYANIPSPEHYVQRIQASHDAKQMFDEVTSKELLHEYILFGLRMNKGISLKLQNSMRTELLAPLVRLVDSGGLGDLIDSGYVLYSQGILKVQPTHMRFCDEFSAEIVTRLKF